jgi:hypothetical protein
MVGVEVLGEEKLDIELGLKLFFSLLIFRKLSETVASKPNNLCGLAVLYHPLLVIAPKPFPRGFKYACKKDFASLTLSKRTCDFKEKEKNTNREIIKNRNI